MARFLTLLIKTWLFSLLVFWILPLRGTAQNWDIRLLEDINLHRNRDLDPLCKHLSNSVAPLSVGLSLSVFVYEYSRSNHTTGKRRGLEMLAVTVGTVALSQGLKWSINRKRPYETYPQLNNAYVADDPSFPSGHTASAFALATSTTLIWPKWYIAVPAYGWAGGVAYSRMHLGLHYPSDVLAGAALGAGSAWLCHYLNKKWFRKTSAKTLL